ncbi:12821_t:CDS:2 [Cetraspora pellucida]|uniref:12821_t:CDS:1 n=1 Tax=Cetraspora pellucida TaxID=1433469 RepID=A0A9N9DSL9_9GLOM|nr:12821_t:CDS:2 [Cetraspora pellucida]
MATNSRKGWAAQPTQPRSSRRLETWFVVVDEIIVNEWLLMVFREI